MMTRNLKALGLALLAVFALGALSASAASAATDHFTAEQNTALLTGASHDNEFRLTPNGVSFSCTTSKFAATITNGATEATVDVSYNGTLGVTPHTSHCTASVGNLTVDMNGCAYILTGNTTQKDEEKTDAVIWITCPEGKQIQLTSSLGITTSIPAQTPTEGGLTYTQEGNKVKITATVTGLTATCAPALACAFGGIPTHSNAYDYIGTALITGYEDKNKAGVITPAEEGAEIGIGVQTTP